MVSRRSLPPAEAREHCNTIQPHWPLRPEGGGDPLTPHDVYTHGRVTTLQAWARAAREELEAMIADALAPRPTTTALQASGREETPANRLKPS